MATKSIELLARDGHFYRANLHAHTQLSDGRLSPEEVKKIYKEHGYAIVAYTDHRHYAYHTELCDETFLALAAYEVDLNQPRTAVQNFRDIKTYHLNLYDTDPTQNVELKKASPLPQIPYSDIAGINAYIQEMRELGFMVCYNHPYWSMQTLDDYKNLRGVFAMEIYNHGCEHDGLYGYNPQVYDEMLRNGNRLGCVSTDDNHNVYPTGHPLCDSFGGFTMIQAPQLAYADVIEALRAGRYYASTGPEIHALWVEGQMVHVTCSPVEKIFMVTQSRECQREVAWEGETITEACFELHGNEGYFRIDCRDEKGMHATSNAYFLDALGLAAR